MRQEITTLLAATAFAAIFLFGHRLRIQRKGWRRSGVSASAGAATAYVFVHLLPELEEAGRNLVRTTTFKGLGYAGARVYLAALAGFVAFYGLEHLVSWTAHPVKPNATHARDPVLLSHIAGFSSYVGMISYLMVRGISSSEKAILLYVVAMGLHFLSVDHSLLRQHAGQYLWPGRYIVATGALAGWVCGMLMEIPKPIECVLMGVVSGGVILNSTISELPREKEGRFWPFVLGAVFYAAFLLLALGGGSQQELQK